MRPWLMSPPIISSRREKHCENHCACIASRNVRAGFSGTQAQTSAMSSSSLRRAGSDSRQPGASLPRVAPRPGRERVTGDDDRLEERLLFHQVDGMVQRIQARPGLLADTLAAASSSLPWSITQFCEGRIDWN